MPKPTDDGGAGHGGDAARDVPADLGAERPTGTTPEGQSCAAGSQCTTGFCADGVCCRSECAGACVTCAASGSVGVCVPAEVGTDPREDCPNDGVASCGRDGECDGAGACRKYPTGTTCKDASCVGSTLTLASRCEAGVCRPKSGITCDPYICDAAGVQCRSLCSTSDDCGPGTICANGSCGKKPASAPCGGPDECQSGFCQQGICCMAKCTDSCYSCAVAGSEGVCSPVPDGADPLGQCADNGAATCGADGMCDGKGGCREYASGTACSSPTCTGSTQITAGRCDGAGACAPGMSRSCDRYACGPGGDCLAKCTGDADCATGYVCNGSICGKKIIGTRCTLGNECDSGFCQQGVCCNGDCSGTCVACNVANKVGTCSPVPQGTDPAAQCAATDPSTCGTTGNCDGAGKCSLQPAGTECAPRSCAGSTQTLAGSCDGAGACTPGAAQMCDPFRCGAAGACLQSCTDGNDCVSPAVCTAMSCGKKPPGTPCATTGECASGFCEQGVCCGTACGTACKSCALKGKEGTCSNIPAGQVPVVSSQCADQGAPSCGTDSTCDGAGACHKYSAGTACAGASCSGYMLSSPRSCNGGGTCVAATVTACPGAFVCDSATNACKTSCAADADCVAPTICNAGVCTKRPLGRTCAAPGDCDSGFCEQGVCCASMCSGTCKSCALPGASLGTCTSVPAGGKDPGDRCPTTAASTCGSDGFCDGAGACRSYVAGTQCAAAACTGSTRTPARTCNGAGVCQTATSSLCDPYLCASNGTCKAACTTATSSSDCVAPNVCNGTSCGKRPNGLACTANGDCNSNVCAQGFCCAGACTGLCQSCGIVGKEGTCSAVPAGSADPMSRCADQGAATCGTNGFCNGSGACQMYATGTVCAAAACSAGATLTLAKACNGTGTCAAPTPATAACAGAFNCDTTAKVCKTTCTIATSAADCAAPAVCTGNICGTLKVQYRAAMTGATQNVNPWFQIVNLGITAVPLSELTARYWYTADGAQGQALQVDYAQIQLGAGSPTTITGNVTGTFTAPTPLRTNADFYLQYAFTTAATVTIPAGGGAALVETEFHSAGYATTYNQTNDYSFDATKTSLADWTHVTLYRNGTLVWGIEPPPAP